MPYTPAEAIQTIEMLDESNLATLVTGSKIPASNGTPEAIAAAGTTVRSVTIFAQRAARTANTSSVWIDWTSGNDTQQIEIPVGGYQIISAPHGKYIDLSQIYIDSVTTGDGVIFRGFK